METSRTLNKYATIAEEERSHDDETQNDLSHIQFAGVFACCCCRLLRQNCNEATGYKRKDERNGFVGVVDLVSAWSTLFLRSPVANVTTFN